MKTRPLVIGAFFALAALAAIVGYLNGGSHSRHHHEEAEATPAATPEPEPVATKPVATPEPTEPAESPLLHRIEEMLALMENHSASPEDIAALKQALLAADPAEAIAAIRGFLDTGRNAATGQDFEIAHGGTLRGAPTLRLMMLDLLGQIARKARSDAASQVALEVLSKKGSADEWALALRNLAWTDPDSAPLLADKVREMFSYEPWRNAPTAGMLEAMDVIVFTKDTSFIPDLAETRAADGDLAHAADIALDRLAETAPLEVLSYLNTHPTTLNDRPFLRADYYAKADLSQPAQRAQVEIYLGRPDVSLDEKTKLLGGLITPASFISDSLITTAPPPDDGSTRRAALVQATGDWLAHNQFPTLRTALQQVQKRLR